MTALYCRVSTKEQAENGNSLQEQQDRLQKYASAFGWDCRIFVDGGYSGAKLDRPAMQELISSITSYERVVVWKLDRLSRSQKDTLHLIEDVFIKNNVQFISVTESFDTSTPYGRAMIGILSAFAQLERETIRDRLMFGKIAVAKKGKLPTSSMYMTKGYDLINGVPIPNGDAEKVKEAFSLYVQGYTKPYIQKITGITARSLFDIFQNRTYIGEIKYDGEWYPSEHKPLIDIDTFEKAQERHRRDTASNTRQHLYSKNLFIGITFCSCGKIARLHQTTTAKGEEYGYYKCYTKGCSVPTIKKEKLEQIVFDEMRKFKLHPVKSPKIDINPYKKKISQLDKQIARLIDLYSIGSFSRKSLTEKVDILNAQKQELENKVISMQSINEKRSKFVDALPNMDELLSGDVEDKKALIHTLISRIVIGDDIEIVWNL